MRNLFLFGTRPEAIKLWPVIDALKMRDGPPPIVCVTAQHREMLDQVLEIAGIVPDHDLDIMTPNQSLDALTARLLTGIGTVLDAEMPDRVIVQGDTATAMAGALAAYYRKIPVSHVEAGLRSGNILHPWPEEVNRRMIAPIADQHFAPTSTAADALSRENISDDQIWITGNTVIDALLMMRDRLNARPALASLLAPVLDRFAGRRIIGVTSHRRENFGGGLDNIANAIAELAQRDDIAFIFPVHPNPNVRGLMHERLGGLANVALIEPLDYPNFVRLQMEAHIMLTDSGGVQEEAPALGKPVLVMRETTERPEGVVAGTAKLVGTCREQIVAACVQLLDDGAEHARMARAHNPFGDGKAAERITDIITLRRNENRITVNET
ncbi:MAG: UDP-N-acetylglucosamine 2-epimerase (non-hydrolyzing) [Blastomonas sp.]